MRNMFPRSGRFQRGYRPSQVDAFFKKARIAYESEPGSDEDTMTGDDVRNAAFDIVADGYSTAHVDAALDRLELALVKRERADFVTTRSDEQWIQKAVERATSLYPRLQRPAGERFADARGQGYSKTEVDALMNRLIDYFENGTPLSAQQIRLSTFAVVRGSKAYDEAIVDTFLDRAVDVLLAVE